MAKRSVPVIFGERIRLRLLTAADLPMTLAWRNQDHIRKWFLNPNVIAEDEHRAWFAGYAGRDDDFVFVIEECRRLHKPVGQVSLYRVNWAEKRGEYGRLLIGEPDATRLGLAREATVLLLEHAFTRLGLTEVELQVRCDNAPAQAIYRGCGFQVARERDGVVTMVLRRG